MNALRVAGEIVANISVTAPAMAARALSLRVEHNPAAAMRANLHRHLEQAIAARPVERQPIAVEAECPIDNRLDQRHRRHVRRSRI